MNDPTDDTLSPLDKPGAVPCFACGKQTDDPETREWTWDEDGLTWVCRQCADDESNQPLGPE